MIKQSEGLVKQFQEIQNVINQQLFKFDKCDNPKSLENQILKQLKKLRQLLNGIKDSTLLETYKKIVIERQQKIKYLIQIKKSINKNQSRAKYIQKLKFHIKTINDKIQNFRQNKDKKKKGNYEKNIQFLRYQANKLQKLRQMLENGKLYLVENMEKLFNNYLSDIFNSFQDTIFQQQLEQHYNVMFILGNAKQSDLQIFNPKIPLKQIKFNPKDFKMMINLSFNNQPKLNDYIPSNEIKDKSNRKLLFPEYKMIDLSTISKMSLETLFLIFHLQKNTTEQYFAAKQLKNKDWRYHTKYNNWFKRFQAPTVQTQEYQKGTYLYFDQEKFITKRKNDFAMRHVHLEDSI